MKIITFTALTSKSHLQQNVWRCIGIFVNPIYNTLEGYLGIGKCSVLQLSVCTDTKISNIAVFFIIASIRRYTISINYGKL